MAFHTANIVVLLLITWMSSSASAENMSDLVVNTIYGQVRGFYQNDSETSTVVRVFQGIPYAKPPLGNLRFRKPRYPDRWSGIFNATTPGPYCPPVYPTIPGYAGVVISEDCLKLQVITPITESPDEGGYPVVLFVSADYSNHTGQYTPTSFSVAGIIYVTMEVRIQALGYFTTGDDKAPGNLPIWDARKALQWVNENIYRFGGDPSRITLYGESQGSSFAHLMIYSPKTNYLFSQVICAGSTAMDATISSTIPVTFSANFATVMNCSGGSSAAIVTCLRNKTLDELYAGNIAIGVGLSSWTLRIDNDMFLGSVQQMILDARPKPLLNSYAKYEAYAIAFIFIPPFAVIGVDASNYATFNRSVMQEKVLQFSGGYGVLAPNVTQLLMDTYTDPPPDGTNNTYYVVDYGNYWNDQFLMPKHEESAMMATLGWPALYYGAVDYYSANQFPSGWPKPASTHNQAEKFLVLHGFGPDTASDAAYTALIRYSYYTFVKTGKPHAAAGVAWERQTPEHPWRFMDLSLTPTMVNKQDENIMKLYTKTIPKLVGVTAMSQTAQLYLSLVHPPY